MNGIPSACNTTRNAFHAQNFAWKPRAIKLSEAKFQIAQQIKSFVMKIYYAHCGSRSRSKSVWTSRNANTNNLKLLCKY